MKYGLAQGRCGIIRIINSLVTRSGMFECLRTLVLGQLLFLPLMAPRL